MTTDERLRSRNKPHKQSQHKLLLMFKLRVRPCGLLNLIRLAQLLYNNQLKLLRVKFKKTKNKVLNTTSLETKFQVRVIAQPEEKDNNETYRKGVRLIQSLNTNLKKPCIVIALHNTLFFHRGLFKGRSHLRSPCIYLAVLNNLICKSGFQNIAIGNYEGSDVLCIAEKLTKRGPLARVFGALKCITK